LQIRSRAGDKTIFSWLGLGRDRNTIDDRLLILGIPGMFAHIRHRIGKDEQLSHEYKFAVAKLITLMRQKGTGLKRMVDFAQASRFRSAKYDQK